MHTRAVAKLNGIKMRTIRRAVFRFDEVRMWARRKTFVYRWIKSGALSCWKSI